MKLIEIEKIEVNNRMRKAKDSKVDELADSIKMIGLINPITVTQDNVLVAGYHRYLALKQLGYETTEAHYMDLSELDAELVEIDENLKRNELNDFELGHFLQRRNEILEAKGLRAKVGFNGNQYTDLGTDTVTPPKTTKEIASDLGMSERAAQRKIQIARDIAPEVQEVITETGNANSTRALLDVARMPQEKQEEVARKLQEKPDARLSKVVEETKKPHVSNNSGNNEWYTPSKFIEAARAVMGSIDTDPASCELANKTVKADVFYTREQNGLDQEWAGNVWMNPPYSSNLINDFCVMLAHKYNMGETKQAIVLVNNATETKWFQHLLESSSAVCFPRSRIKFIDTNGNPSGAPLQGQAIIYMGSYPDKFSNAFEQFGMVLYAGKG